MICTYAARFEATHSLIYLIGSVVGDLYLYYKNMDTILQGTANADAIRQQINSLSTRMEKTVEKLKQVEGQT